jgi:hypothetical protein
VEEQKELLWKRLDKWQKNMEVGMTKEKYLSLCEQMGTEPSDDKCPPEFEDFPLPAQQAIEVFNKLGDRVVADIGYMGKYYESLPIHMEILGVTNKEIFLETLLRLDSSMIKRSSDEMKKARDKIKKK